MSSFLYRSCFRIQNYKKIVLSQSPNICLIQRLSNRPNRIPSKKYKVKSPVTWKTLGITACISSICLGILYFLQNLKDRELEKAHIRQIGKAAIGGPFELLNTEGKLVKSEDFHGKWLLVYFGFTHCPDVCPDEIEKLSKVVDKLEKVYKLKVQPLFITVDPERDTPEIVGKYLKEFSDKFIGLAGTPEQIAKVCKSYRIYFSNGPKDTDNDYIVDHTILIYLLDPEGNFIDYYGQNHNVDSIVSGVMVNKAKYENVKKDSIFSSFVADKLGIAVNVN